MARKISTQIVGPVALAPTDNPLTITATGGVTSTGAGIDGIDGAAGTTWRIANDGTVTSASGVGVRLAGNGTVSNGSSVSPTALIVGDSAGIAIYGSQASVTNAGIITGNSAVLLNAGGTATNGA